VRNPLAPTRTERCANVVFSVLATDEGGVTIAVVRSVAGKLLIGFLLTVATAACIAELTGRWDRTIRDANDEAGLVSIVLCVGAAVTLAATLLKCVLPPACDRFLVHFVSAVPTSVLGRRPSASTGPPIALRI
jgi:hypothetical protein